MKTLLTLFFLFFINLSFPQKNYDKEKSKFEKRVIHNKQKNKEVVLKIDENHNFTTRYLGKVKTKYGKEYYVITILLIGMEQKWLDM